MRQSWETMTSVSAGHIIQTPTQPVGSGRPQRESNPGPPHQESRALPQSYRAPEKQRERQRERETERVRERETDRERGRLLVRWGYVTEREERGDRRIETRLFSLVFSSGILELIPTRHPP